jgi:hypothetical protein
MHASMRLIPSVQVAIRPNTAQSDTIRRNIYECIARSDTPQIPKSRSQGNGSNHLRLSVIKKTTGSDCSRPSRHRRERWGADGFTGLS